MTGQRFLSISAVAILAAGLFLIGDHAYTRAKAWLAERLIARAFAAHLVDGRAHRPWRWADFHPVARVDVERLGVHRFVLSSAAGSALAFGLGRVDGTAVPGGLGRCTLAGHRDTWAAFLRDLRTGDVVRITTRDGAREYRVAASKVVDRRDLGVLETADGGSRLTFVTCYPFSGVTRSPWRYLVDCEPLPAAAMI